MMTEEERMKQRQVENGILAKAKDDPVGVINDAVFSGKIVRVYRRGKETFFIVTCGHPGMKRGRDGKINRNIITIRFLGKEGEYYAKKFHQDEFATFHAVAQTKINRRYETRTLEMWGLSIEPGELKITPQDVNQVHLVGKIVTSQQDSDSWASVFVKTQIWKTRPNIFSEDIDEVESLYRSVTKVRINGGRDTKHMVERLLTKGTIIDVNGHVYGRIVTDQETGQKRRVMSLVADQVNAVGMIQPSDVDATTTVYNPENIGAGPEENEEE